MRHATVALVLAVSALLGVGVAVERFRRGRMQEAARARERAAAEHLVEVGRCLTLVHWELDPLQGGGALVRAEVLPGRDGRVALDAHGSRGDEDVLVPELQTERLVPAVVQAGRVVTLERRLRRVRVGEVDDLALRFSCRPPGPEGVFGVIEYSSTVQAEAADGFGGLVRPLPSSAR